MQNSSSMAIGLLDGPADVGGGDQRGIQSRPPHRATAALYRQLGTVFARLGAYGSAPREGQATMQTSDVQRAVAAAMSIVSSLDPGPGGWYGFQQFRDRVLDTAKAQARTIKAPTA